MIFTDYILKCLPVISEDQEDSESWHAEEFIQVGLQEYDNTMKYVLESINAETISDENEF